MPMARFVLGEHSTGGDVQGRKQRRGAVAQIVVGDAFHVAQAHGQDRLRAFQSLDLTFLIDAQHQRLIGGMQIQPDDVADFLDENGSVERLK